MRSFLIATLLVAGTAHASLDASLRAAVDKRSAVTWVRWSVPGIDSGGDGGFGCSWNRNGVYRSAGELRFDDDRRHDDGRRRVERRTAATPRTLYVFAGFRYGELGAVRVYDDLCAPDAQVERIDPVEPAQTLAWLADRARDHDIAEESRDVALVGVAHLDVPGAVVALERLAHDRNRQRAENAVFWLGEARGEEGVSALDRILEEEPPTDFRQHMTFAYSLSSSPRGIERLISIARRDPTPSVRSQALFWMAQHAAERAIPEIERAVEDDPEREVREQAVFALSQLPDDEGIPLLIRLAERHHDPAVRKAAMFWLGESGSARAIEFFEGILE